MTITIIYTDGTKDIFENKHAGDEDWLADKNKIVKRIEYS